MENFPLLRIAYGDCKANEFNAIAPIFPGNSIKLVKNVVSDQFSLNPNSIELFINDQTLSDDGTITDALLQAPISVRFREVEIGNFYHISLKRANHPLVTMKIDENTTAHDVAFQLAKIFLDHSRFNLYFADQLLNPELIISSLDLDGKIIQVFPAISPIESNSLCIRLKPMEGVPHSVFVPLTTTVAELKLKVNQIYSNYEPNITILIHNGRRLQDEARRLNEIEGMQDCAEIKLVRQPTNAPARPIRPPLTIIQQPGRTSIAAPRPESTPTAHGQPIAAGAAPRAEPTPLIQPVPFPGGVMVGTVSIDITPSSAIDPNSMQSIVSNLARSITDSLIPQIQQATARSSPVMLDEESLLRIEIDSIHNEYKELLRIFRIEDSIAVDSNPLVTLERILRHMSSTGSNTLYERITQFTQCCIQGTDYANDARSQLQEAIGRFQKIFGYVLNLIKAFKFENGRVRFSFQAAHSTQPQIAINPSQIISFANVDGGVLRALLDSFFRSITQGEQGRAARNATLKRILSLPLHPILAEFLDSFSIQELLSAMSPTAGGEARYRFLMGSLVRMVDLLQACVFRARPYSEGLAMEEAEALWHFVQREFTGTDISPFKSVFVELFSEFCKIVGEHSHDPHSIQVKTVYARRMYEFLGTIASKLAAVCKENAPLVVSLVRRFSSNPQLSRVLFDAFGCQFLEEYGSVAYAEILSTSEPSMPDSESKRRRESSLDAAVSSMPTDSASAQLREFIKYDKDGFFNEIFQ